MNIFALRFSACIITCIVSIKPLHSSAVIPPQQPKQSIIDVLLECYQNTTSKKGKRIIAHSLFLTFADHNKTKPKKEKDKQKKVSLQAICHDETEKTFDSTMLDKYRKLKIDITTVGYTTRNAGTRSSPVDPLLYTNMVRSYHALESITPLKSSDLAWAKQRQPYSDDSPELSPDNTQLPNLASVQASHDSTNKSKLKSSPTKDTHAANSETTIKSQDIIVPEQPKLECCAIL